MTSPRRRIDTAEQLAQLKASEELMETVRKNRPRKDKGKAVDAMMAAYRHKTEKESHDAKKLR